MRLRWLTICCALITVMIYGCSLDDSSPTSVAEDDISALPSSDADNTSDEDDAGAVAQADVAAPGSDTAVPGDGISIEQISVGDFVFDARVAGPADGELVLMLHGFPQTSLEYEAQLIALADAGYRAVAPNQRGYSPGAQPPEESSYRIEFLVEDVLGMADALGADTFHLVGHDWGAMVAWAVAIEFPERLKSLATISVPHPQPFLEASQNPESCQKAASSYFDLLITPGSELIILANDAAQLKGFYAGLPQHHIDDYVAVLSEGDTLKYAINWYRANLGANTPEEQFGPTAAPTLFVWSTDDTAICDDAPYKTMDYCTGPYEFLVLEDIDHWIPENAADALNKALLKHLAAHGD
ncbi:MAG: alpha/beta hydrolase [Myxococcota bacterium]|nr:alpha/beta hydrolase [Myxococcota bacterium]